MRWSTDVHEADWIGPRLEPFDAGFATSVAPSGFAAYARILHPVETPRDGRGRTVRWADVAAWSGLPLERGTQFPDIALPRHDPGTPAPWDSQGPEVGSLTADDCGRLIDVLAEHTSTPDRCWFCLWDGYGWDSATSLSVGRDTGIRSRVERAADPVPAHVRSGPRVRLPHRDYLLYTDTIDGALAFAPTQRQTPNLWWPADRSWCVASEIDLRWTYVGGSVVLVEDLLAAPGIEVLPADPRDSNHRRIPGWLADHVEEAVTDLLSHGAVTLPTSRGTVHATLERPGRFRWRRGGAVRTWSDADGWPRSGWTSLSGRSDDALRGHLRSVLTDAVLGLVQS